MKIKFKRVIYDLLYILINYFIAYIPSWTIRKIMYQICGMKIGKNTRINMRCTIMNPWNITIGKNSIINEYVILDGRGGLTIGDNCSISMYAVIYSASHRPDSEEFEYYEQNTVIQSGVWIGTRAMILAGTVINANCIIGANSVITSIECEEGGIYVGVPGRKIKRREIKNSINQNICVFFR